MKNFFSKIGSAIKSTWSWLDGKKTVIGGVAVMVADFLPDNSKTKQVLKIAGYVLGAGGLTHKAKKNLPTGKRK